MTLFSAFDLYLWPFLSLFDSPAKSTKSRPIIRPSLFVRTARGSPFPHHYFPCVSSILFPSILSSSSMGLSILGRRETFALSDGVREMEVSTKKIHPKNNKNNDGKRCSHTHTKRNKGTGIDACKKDQRWARWFWLSTLISFCFLFYYTIYLFTFIDGGGKSTCQQAFSLSLSISPLIC